LVSKGGRRKGRGGPTKSVFDQGGKRARKGGGGQNDTQLIQELYLGIVQQADKKEEED